MKAFKEDILNQINQKKEQLQIDRKSNLFRDKTSLELDSYKLWEKRKNKIKEEVNMSMRAHLEASRMKKK